MCMKSGKEKILKFIKDYLIYALFFLMLGFQVWQNYKFSKVLSLFDSFGENRSEFLEEMTKTRSYVSSFGADLNQIRKFLLLPATDYSYMTQDEVESSGDEEDLSLQIFTLVAKLGDVANAQQLYEENLVLVKEYFAKTDFAAYGLNLASKEGENSGDALVFKLFDSQNPDIQILSLGLDGIGNLEVSTYYSHFSIDAVSEVDDFLKNDLAALRESIGKNKELRSQLSSLVFQNAEFQNVLKENSLSLDAEAEDEVKYYYVIRNKSGENLNAIALNKVESEIYFVTGDDEDDGGIDQSNLLNGILFVITQMDGRTETEILLENRAVDLENLFEDAAFLAALKVAGFSMGAKEDLSDRIRIAIYNSKGEIIKYIVLFKHDASIKVESPDGSVLDLSTATSLVLAQKKTLELPVNLASYDDLQDNPDDLNILLLGKNGTNVDTIMFANISSKDRKISLISVPRDLYYDERKINSVYAEFGIFEFVNQLEEILGFKIHKYILIDMYVFRDVVDLIGGIDITLEEDLIDPSYKTCDNGICSTLYYPAGFYHLNGTQALRVARSRHYSSDYSRAERQQLILEAVKSKIQDLKIGDANTVLEIIKTVIGSTETNMGIDEALLHYFRFQNFDLSRGNVLSTANVLESRPVEVDYKTNHLEKVCENESREETCVEKYYIDTLSPREDNWDYIKWWVSSLLS